MRSCVRACVCACVRERIRTKENERQTERLKALKINETKLCTLIKMFSSRCVQVAELDKLNQSNAKHRNTKLYSIFESKSVHIKVR